MDRILPKGGATLALLWGMWSISLYADLPTDLLSKRQNLLFEYDYRSNAAQSAKLQKSWINPIMLRYNREFSEQFGDKTYKTGSFTVSIDQPIFRSGGIYYAIRYARALKDANSAQITLNKRQRIAQAVKLLFEIKKSKLQIAKLKLLIQNDAIDIRQKRERYRAGVLDSSFLDQAILKKNLDEARVLEAQEGLLQLKERFGLLSDKDPDSFKLPTLKQLSQKRYQRNNLELARDRYRVEQEHYNAKMTWAKYLPTLSVHARYTDEDINPLFARGGGGLKERYRTYGVTLSMPLDINMFADVEQSKVAALKAETALIEQQRAVDSQYRLAEKRVEMIDRKIALARKNEKLYRNLYRVTKNLAAAGEKTDLDARVMQHSLQIKKLDEKIYYYEKQMVLLELYAKVHDAI